MFCAGFGAVIFGAVSAQGKGFGVERPASDYSLAAPNGCSKLIIPYENTLESIANGRFQLSHERGLHFVGNRDNISSESQFTPELYLRNRHPFFAPALVFLHSWLCRGLLEAASA